jgi:hypothetical protein
MPVSSNKGESHMEILDKKELSWFKPDPNQPRKAFDPAELEALEESLFVRQDIPLIAFVDGTIQDGERRWRAAQLRGRIKTLDVVITDKPGYSRSPPRSTGHRSPDTRCGRPASICSP